LFSDLSTFVQKCDTVDVPASREKMNHLTGYDSLFEFVNPTTSHGIAQSFPVFSHRIPGKMSHSLHQTPLEAPLKPIWLWVLPLEDTFTLSYITGRSVGIGAYLNRLGQRNIQMVPGDGELGT
jgi:hypothetical protein